LRLKLNLAFYAVRRTRDLVVKLSLLSDRPTTTFLVTNHHWPFTDTILLGKEALCQKLLHDSEPAKN